MAQRVRDRDEFVSAGHFPLLHRTVPAADELAQAGRACGDRTLRASLARLRTAASAGPAQSALSAVIAWAGHRLGTLANRYQLAALSLTRLRSQRCPSRRERDR